MRIEKELNVLVEQPLIDMGRAANLFWLCLGEKLVTTDIYGREKLKSRYALHIQCSWRLTKEKKIIVASGDFYTPKTGLSEDNFEWDRPGVNRFDEKIADFKKKLESKNIVVTALSADEFGGFKLCFTSGFILEVFPNDSLEDEFWRLIISGEGYKHFVVFDKD